MHPPIDPPFLFNAWKHHLGFLRRFVDNAIGSKLSKEELKVYLVKMGNSMIDVYYGPLSIGEITGDVRSFLIEHGSFDSAGYHRLINKCPGKFHNIKISDGSEWTLLLGNDSDRYVHIHPARRSRHTMRVRAIALKTALLIMIYYPKGLPVDELVESVNLLRKEFLDESPIKNVSYTRSISKVLDIF